MKYDRLLAGLSAMLVIFTTWMTGLGRGDSTAYVPLIAGAVAAVVMVDLLRWLYLPRFAGNLILIAIAVVMLSDFLQHSSREQLTIIGNLLVAVQTVLLCERKSTRIHGEILVFSLLTVVVAALLNRTLFFGAALLGYTVVALFTLSVYAWNRTIESSGVVRRRWRAAPSDVALTTLTTGQPHPPSPWRLGYLLSAIVLPTFLFGAAFFSNTPRLGGAGWNMGGLGFQSQVGFSPEISFDDMSKLLTNETVVMRVSFRDLHDEQPYDLLADPYFFGAALGRYVVRDGKPQWKVDWLNRIGTIRKLPPVPNRLVEPVRVDVQMEPSKSTRLFYLYPAYAAADTPDEVRFDPNHQDLYRRRNDGRAADRQDFAFALVTSAFRNGLSLSVTPHINPVATAGQRAQLEAEKHRLTRLGAVDSEGAKGTPAEEWKPLVELARQIVAHDAPNGGAFEKALALNAWFRRSGRFRYTLDLREVERRRRPDLDPIVDFVLHHKTGHCQYFASGLAMMLRAVGIPSRVVVGYKGGDFNPLGSFYIVRQKHAHAWVEAYLEPDEIPRGRIEPSERHPGGGWLRLDPTPNRNRPLVEPNGLMDRLQVSIDYAQWMWNDYVVKLDPEQQGWNPSRAVVKERSWIDLLSATLMNRRDRSAASANRQQAWNRRMVVWIGLVGLVVVGLFYLSVPFWHGRRRPRRLRRRLRRAAYAPYVRFEKEMARYGWRRRPAQTPRQFATECGSRLATELDDPTLEDLPLIVVDTYYQVRFDPQADSRQAEVPPRVEEALDALRRLYHRWRRLASTRST